MSHIQKATSSKTSSYFFLPSNYSLKEGYVDPQSLSIFIKSLGLCASCSEGSLITSPNPVCFLPLPHILTLFDFLPCILMCLTPKISFTFICLFFTFFSCFFLSYKFSLSVLSLAHSSYVSIFLSLHLITNPILCVFISFPSVA